MTFPVRIQPRLVVAFFLVLMAVLPRMLALDHPMNQDTSHWITRSSEFVRAVYDGNFEATLRSKHPGVTIMIAAGASISAYIAASTWAQGKTLNDLRKNPPTYDELFQQFPMLLTFAKLPIVVLTLLGLLGVFILLRKLVGEAGALGGILFLAIDPFYIGLSRALHLDAIAAIASVLALLSCLWALDSRCKYCLLMFAACGALAGLAMLTRSFSVLLIPVVGVILALDALAKARERTSMTTAAVRVMSTYATFMITAAGVFCVLLPVMWVNPVGALSQVFLFPLGNLLDPAVSQEAPALPKLVYFRGEITVTPPFSYYAFAVPFRILPETFLFAALGIASLFGFKTDADRAESSSRWAQWALLGYGLALTLALSFFTMKADRYILPLFMAIDITAGIAFAGIVVRVAGWVGLNSTLKALAAGVAVLVLLALPISRLITLHPNYLTYWNNVLYSPESAYHTFHIGWGEGLSEAASYLNSKPNSARLKVASSNERQFSPYFSGFASDLGKVQCESNFDYIVLAEHNIQRRLPEALIQGLLQTSPERQFDFWGLPYTKVYTGPFDFVASDDCIRLSESPYNP